MNRSGDIGRADLIEALADADDGWLSDEVQALLGFERRQKEPAGPATPAGGSASQGELPGSEKPELDTVAGNPERIDIPFWQPVRMTFDDTAAAPVLRAVNAGHQDVRWRGRPTAPPTFSYLAEWRDLDTRLREVPGRNVLDDRIDLDRTIRRIAEGEVLQRFPMRPPRRWGQRLHLVEDLSRRLLPLRRDQRLVRLALRRILPKQGFLTAFMRDGMTRPGIAGAEDDFPIPGEGTLVLVLGDLGAYDRGSQSASHWLAFGRAVRESGADPVALFPGAPERCLAALRDVWTVLPWERRASMSGVPASEAAVRRLFRLVSPLSRVEPGALRAVRRLLPLSVMDVSTEIEFWAHDWLASDHAAAATIDPSRHEQLRDEFLQRETPEMQARFWRTVRPWRRHLDPDIWFDEVFAGGPDAWKLLPEDDVDDTLRDFARLQESVACSNDGVNPDYLDRFVRRGSLSLARFPEGQALLDAHHRLFRDNHDYEPVPGLEPGHVNPPVDAPVRRVEVLHVGGHMEIRAAASGFVGPGSSLAMIETRNQEIKVAEVTDTPRNTFWASGIPPSWVSDWGHDDHGAWCAFEVGSVVQRLRWIPPGAFMMGSSEDEPGRYDDEGPRHRVEIGEGFWLAETPCTQALWQAVMGENPSRFVDPERPVEQVSWDDVAGFIEVLNDRVPGLEMALPSEARWEFACRAGTATATWVGAMEILDLNNAPVLDAIACYGGNSGVGFDLEEGFDSSDWTGKQHPHEKAGTRRVGLKKANPLGLHDMLGNVWEWCADDRHDSYEGAPTDGSAWLDSDDVDDWRWGVVRGGSWISGARDVRSACRHGRPPAGKGDAIGFRLARVQQGAVPAKDGAVPPTERQEAPARPGGAEMICLTDDAGSAGIPAGPAIRISSDVATLQLRQITKPDWASAIGRDVYGLWTEFELPDTETPVSQRLRWIPPGQFMMGSPEDEQERLEFEGPPHLVRIAKGFWLADTTCTQALWTVMMGDNPSNFRGDDLPVETVNWDDVQQFLARLNDRVPGLSVQLPSEAQWEYACRAGTDTPFSTGVTIRTDQANFNGIPPDRDAVKDWSRQMTMPVRSFRPNRWGLWQMHGNVGELCADDWHESYVGAPGDGGARLNSGEDSRRVHVIRGGSWVDSTRVARSAFRYWVPSGIRSGNLGFRLARVQSS